MSLIPMDKADFEPDPREEQRDLAIHNLLKRCRPIFDYFEKLARWDGGCALPEGPSKGERLDFCEACAKLTKIEQDRRREERPGGLMHDAHCAARNPGGICDCGAKP